MRRGVSGRIVLVTGASRGLGAGIAQALGERGARVAVNYAHSEDAARAVAKNIQERGGAAMVCRADVRDPAQVREMVGQIERQYGPVDVLVNNAAGNQPMLPLEQYSWQDFQEQLDFFVKAPVVLTQAVIGKMKEARWGRIINIGSEVVSIGPVQFSAYVAAKGAMVALTRAWAREFGPHSVTVNTVSPGWIPVERHRDVPEPVMKAYASRVPLGRQGVPEDIGEAVAFLAGDEASFITGQNLTVNGGNTFGC